MNGIIFVRLPICLRGKDRENFTFGLSASFHILCFSLFIVRHLMLHDLTYRQDAVRKPRASR